VTFSASSAFENPTHFPAAPVSALNVTHWFAISEVHVV
jgi:hypothetical protein